MIYNRKVPFFGVSEQLLQQGPVKSWDRGGPKAPTLPNVVLSDAWIYSDFMSEREYRFLASRRTLKFLKELRYLKLQADNYQVFGGNQQHPRRWLQKTIEELEQRGDATRALQGRLSSFAFGVYEPMKIKLEKLYSKYFGMYPAATSAEWRRIFATCRYRFSQVTNESPLILRDFKKAWDCGMKHKAPYCTTPLNMYE